MSVAEIKKIQRRQLLQIRKYLPTWYQDICSLRICEQIIQLPIYQRASRIALYRAFRGEVALERLWHHAVGEGKTCYFPILKPKHELRFVEGKLEDQFEKNALGLLEPKQAEQTISLSEIDVFFLPLVGFDRQGHRLGSGAGCYDRILAQVRSPMRVGVGYAFQELKMIATESNDMLLNLIVTEQGVIHPNRNAS